MKIKDYDHINSHFECIVRMKLAFSSTDVLRLDNPGGYRVAKGPT